MTLCQGILIKVYYRLDLFIQKNCLRIFSQLVTCGQCRLTLKEGLNSLYLKGARHKARVIAIANQASKCSDF